MKKIIVMELMFLASFAMAQTSITGIESPPGVIGPAVSAPAKTISQFVKDSVDSAETGAAFNLVGQKFADLYVPLRTVDVPWPNVIDAGVGGVFGAGHPDGLIAARINLPQIANGIFGTRWFVSHTHGPVLPTLFLGPAVKAAWPPNSWRWDHDAFMLLSIPLSTMGL